MNYFTDKEKEDKFMTNFQKNEIDNIVKAIQSHDAAHVVSSIEIAKYCADTKMVDLYIKIDGKSTDEIENYVSEYNFLHKKDENAIYLIIDFIGPDEANGTPIWQRGCENK